MNAAAEVPLAKAQLLLRLTGPLGVDDPVVPRAEVGSPLRWRIARRLVDDPTDVSVGHVWQASTAGYDVVVEAAGPRERLVTALGAALETISGQVDRDASTLIAGHEHVVIPSANRLRLLRLRPIRRLPGMDRERFADHWLNHHGPLAAGPPPMLAGYRQFHADPQWQGEFAGALDLPDIGLDGAAESYFPDMPAFMAMRANPAVVGPAFDDERRFLDITFVVPGLYEVAELAQS